ncbi:MAG: hypothetical protein ACUVQP_05600 [Bacteroidales bacterium]
MNEIGDIVEIIAAVTIFIIGLLFAVPSTIDLAVMVAESFLSVMPSGTSTQMLETWILAFRIFGYVLMLGDVITVVALIRSRL